MKRREAYEIKRELELQPGRQEEPREFERPPVLG
jgi:hypothetical protein